MNSVLDPNLAKLWQGNLKEDLKNDLHIKPHSYQGKDGAYAGPECDKILNNLDILKERLMATEDLKLFYNFLFAFKKLKDGIFGNVLAENWKELCADFRTGLNLLYSNLAVPITPKLHIISVHVEEWVDTHRRAIGEDMEQVLEASHGRFEKIWESYQVRDEDSDAFLHNGLAAGLHFNSDNTIA